MLSMFINIFSLWFVVIFTLIPHFSLGLVLVGELHSKEDWALITRFRFLPEGGKLAFKIEYEKEYGTPNLLVYYDTSDQWNSVSYHPELTCKQREMLLNETSIISLYNNPACLRGKSGHMMSCSAVFNILASKEGWWSIAISNCNSSGGLHLTYQLQMTNGEERDFWNKHFSADEFYVLPVLLSFLVVYVILIIAVAVSAVKLKKYEMYVVTYKLFIASVILQEIGIICQTIAYINQAFNGKRVSGLQILGHILQVLSETIFVLLLILLAKGYTVTVGRLKLSTIVKIAVFMVLYAVSCIVIISCSFDPGKFRYVYKGSSGYGLIIARILAWWIFLMTIVFSLKYNPEKAYFYYIFNTMGSLWFVFGPILILITNTFIEEPFYESFICGVVYLSAFCGHLQFLFLTLPTKANKVFPFNVQTSQMAVHAADSDGTSPVPDHAGETSTHLPPIPAHNGSATEPKSSQDD